MNPDSKALWATIALAIFAAASATAVEISVNDKPVKSGTGANLVARYSNVAKVKSRRVDLLAEIVSQTPSNITHDFSSHGDDFKFVMYGAVEGAERVATVRYTFVESGTDTPVTIPKFALTIDDFDDYFSRTESVSTRDASTYILDSPTNVRTEVVDSTVTFTGSEDQKPGDPEAAVKLRFATRSSFTLTYSSVDYMAGLAGFVHNGDGEFEFEEPIPTTSPKRIYYTFTYTNEENGPVEMDFQDTLPEGLQWDTKYVPETVGDFGDLKVNYRENSTEAWMSRQLMPPGSSSFKLRTLPTQMTGTIDNEADMLFAHHAPRKFGAGQNGSSSTSDAEPNADEKETTLITETTVSSSITLGPGKKKQPHQRGKKS